MSALAIVADVVGVLIVGAVLYDVVSTALFLGHSGPLTRQLLHAGWRAALAVHRRRPNHAVLRRAGHTILVFTVVVWLLLVYLGWSLVFLWPEAAVVRAPSGAPGGVLDRLYYVGTAITSLGMGDFRAQTGWSQVATISATITGLFLVTLSVTYLVQVVGAASRRHQLAVELHALGATPQDLLLAWWTGRDFGDVSAAFLRTTSSLSALAEAHLVFPVLHLFHAEDVRSALAPNAVVFDQAVTILEHGVRRDVAPSDAVLTAAHEAVDRYVETTAHFDIGVSGSGGRVPSLGRLRARGVPVVGDTEFRARAGTTRLHDLSVLLNADGWVWNDLKIAEEDLQPERGGGDAAA